jgi:hypothetical protein
VCKQVSILSLFVFLSSFALGQQVTVRGQFHADSIKIGEPIPYSLTARYPRNADVLFPDSLFSFAPFEFQKKKFFTTRTKDSTSYDSVVYYLSTFEIDSVQKLSLPVYIIHPQDCTKSFAASDSILIRRLVKKMPDSLSLAKLPLKMTVAYQPVSWVMNYPLLLLISGILLVAVVASFLIFGGRIRRYFIVRKLQKNHLAFLDRFNSFADQLRAGLSSTKAEEAVLTWKKYMEDLAAKPFTKYTSREIVQQEADENLGSALRSIDRFIYGGLKDYSDESISTLRAYSEQQYQKKLEEVKNG